MPSGRRPSPVRPPAGRFGVTARGPRGLQPALREPRTAPFPPPPPGWAGPLDEWAIYWAHSALGLQQGHQWDYQSPQSGGRLQFGGFVLDFYEYDAGIGINVQGDYWHYQRGTPQFFRDQDQRYALAHFGILLVFIDEADALLRPVSVLRDARNGIDRSKGKLA